MDFQQSCPSEMDRNLEVIKTNPFTETGVLLGASSLSGRIWSGSLWYYDEPCLAGTVDDCTAGVRLVAGVTDAVWVRENNVAVSLDTGEVVLWDLCDEKRFFEFNKSLCNHGDLSTSLSVSADQSRLVSTGQDGSIIISDLSTAEVLHSYIAPFSPVHHDAVSMAACHPSKADIFISCGYDGCVFLWDTRNKRPAKLIESASKSSYVTCVDWQPDRDYCVALGNEEGQIMLKDISAPLEVPLHHKCHKQNVHRLLFSHSHPSLLASVSDDFSVVVSDVKAGDIVQKFRDTRHRDFVRGVTWYGVDGLITCGWDTTVLSHVCNGNPVGHAPADSSSVESNNKVEIDDS